MESVTVLLFFKTQPQPEYLLFGDNVIQQIRTNEIFASLKPLVDPVIVSHGIFRTAFNVAKTGNAVAKEDRDAKHQADLVLMVELAKGVEKLANGSRAIIMASGFKPSSVAQALNELATPENFKTYNLERKGSIYLSWTAVAKKVSYTIEMRVVGTEIWQAAATPTAANYTFDGLKRGLHLEFRVRATGTRNIVSDWSVVNDVFVD